MTEEWQPTVEPLVLHVIPTPLARGAQREARALADRLDAPGRRAHRVLSLFDGPPDVRPDFSLHAPAHRATVAYDARVVVRLRSALGRLDPSLIVAHGGEPLKYLVPAMVGRRTPLVYYAIGTFSGRPDRALQVALWRRLVARADAVTAEGYEVADECTSLLHVPIERVTMTPNGRDADEFRPSATGQRSSTPSVAFVGALNEGKGPDRFIETVARLRERGLVFDARLIGDGPLRQALVGSASAAGVEMLGSRSDIADLLRTVDLMMFPSRPTGEGMPGVLIEAGLSGVPVVATDVPGARTVIEDGVTGIVVADGAGDDLVVATARLLTDAGLRTEMGAAARTRCVERFRLEAIAALWLEVLDPLLPASAVSTHRQIDAELSP